MKKIEERELIELANISGISTFELQKLFAMGIIDESRALDYVIHDKYKKIRHMGKYKPAQIIQRLSEEYHLTISQVQAATDIGDVAFAMNHSSAHRVTEGL